MAKLALAGLLAGVFGATILAFPALDAGTVPWSKCGWDGAQGETGGGCPACQTWNALAPMGWGFAKAEQGGAPEIRPVSDVTMAPGERGLVRIPAGAHDAGHVTVELGRAPGFASLSGDMVRLAPSHGDIGTHDITVLATAGGTMASERFSVTVSEKGAAGNNGPGYGALLFSDDFESGLGGWNATSVGRWDVSAVYDGGTGISGLSYGGHAMSSHTCTFTCRVQISTLFDTASPLELTFERYVGSGVGRTGLPPEGLYVEYQPHGRGKWVTVAEFLGGGSDAGLWVAERIVLDIPEDTAYLRFAARSSDSGGVIQFDNVKASSPPRGVVFWDDFEPGIDSSWYHHGPRHWEIVQVPEWWSEWNIADGYDVGDGMLSSSDCDYQCVIFLKGDVSDSPVILNFDRYVDTSLRWDERLEVQVGPDGWRTVAEYADKDASPNHWTSESIPLDGLPSLRFVATSASEFNKFYIDNIEVYEAPR